MVPGVGGSDLEIASVLVAGPPQVLVTVTETVPVTKLLKYLTMMLLVPWPEIIVAVAGTDHAKPDALVVVT